MYTVILGIINVQFNLILPLFLDHFLTCQEIILNDYLNDSGVQLLIV